MRAGRLTIIFTIRDDDIKIVCVSQILFAGFLSYDELSSEIDDLEKVIELLKYGGHIGAERLLVQQFIHHGRSPSGNVCCL